MTCSKCNGQLSRKEFNYSIEHFSKPLCRNCQKSYAPLEAKLEKKKKKSTPEATKLYNILLKMGIKAQLEQWDGYKHIDIAIPEAKVNIEVDGMQHAYSDKQALADLKRTFHSWKKGYVTLRIPNKLLQEGNLFETAKYIKQLIESSAEQIEKDKD